MNSAELFLWILDNLNYWVVTLFMAIESSFVPFPSEVVVPPAAWKAMDPNSGLNFVLVIVFATVGANIGALINYYIAKWLGRPIIYRFADSRIGHMCLIDRPADFGWSDLGTWGSLLMQSHRDLNGNATIGNNIQMIESKNNIVHTLGEKKVMSWATSS